MALQALINKLLNTPSTTNTLQFTGPGFDKAKVDLQQRLPSLEEPTLIALAAFLRYVNLNAFTDEELTLLASIDFKGIENNTRGKARGFVFTNTTSYYDLDGLQSLSSEQDLFITRNAALKDSAYEDLNSLIPRNKNTNLTYLAVLLSHIV